MFTKKIRQKALVFAAAAAFPFLAGCVSSGYATYGPPAEEVEVYGVAPGPDFIWVGGRHIWRGGGYAWQKGSWQKPPRAGAQWEKGNWEHSDRGWRYRDGSWK